MFQPLVVKHTQSLSSLIYTANMSHTHVNNPASSTPLLQPSLPLFSLSQPSLSPPLPLCQRLLLLLPCGGGHDLRIRNPTCFKMIMNITKVVLTAPRKKKKSRSDIREFCWEMRLEEMGMGNNKKAMKRIENQVEGFMVWDYKLKKRGFFFFLVLE